ncbi:MAG: cytochrome c5 family protein [Rhizobacter sp.]|nr:cytochrome c5 family protein [Rhizobacter sp.]
MSDHHHTEHDDAPHEGPIKNVKQLIAAVIFAFIVPIAVIVLLVTRVGADPRSGAGSDAAKAEAVARRIQPVASVEVKDASDVASLKTGEQVVAAQCGACHNSGAAGAPKIGDAAAWAPRLAQGLEALLNSALKGKGAMGPQGGGDFSDFEIARAVVFMGNQSGGKLAEPKAPAAASAASDAK